MLIYCKKNKQIGEISQKKSEHGLDVGDPPDTCDAGKSDDRNKYHKRVGNEPFKKR